MTFLILLITLWVWVTVASILILAYRWFTDKDNEPPEEWHWGGDDYPKDIFWVRSLGEYAPQGSKPESAADSPVE